MPKLFVSDDTRRARSEGHGSPDRKLYGTVIVSDTEPVRTKGIIWLDLADNSGSSGVRNPLTITSDITLDLTHDAISADATSGPIVITLPPAGLRRGKQYDIKKVDPTANPVKIRPDGSDTIDLETGDLIIEFQGNTVELIGDDTDTNWDRH